jgi:outer membrane protein assembly factor BamB
MTTPSRFAAAVFVSSAVYGGALLAADWPSFRGPRGGAVSDDKDVPVQWTDDNFLWKRKLPGPGASSPITCGARVFVTCYTGYGTSLTKGFAGGFGKGGFGKGGFGKGNPADAAGQKKLRFVVLCLDGKSGEVLWQKEVEPKLPETPFTGMIREHGYATSTPATDGERLYVFLGKTGVHAFDMDGNAVWRADVGGGVNTWGMAASPVLHDGLVIVNAAMESRSLIGLERKTGKEVWRTKGMDACWGSPIVAETTDGKHELVVSLPGKIAGFDPATGQELWHCEGFQGGSMPGYGGTYSTPVAKDGIVYVTGGGGPRGPSTALAIRTGGRGDVNKTHIVWKQKAGGNFNSPVVHGAYLYCIDGMAICLRADTGKVVYKERLYESRGEYVSPVVAGDKVFMLTRFDGLYVLAAGAEFRQPAHNEFPGDRSVFNANPAIGNGRLYVRSNEYLYCIGPK